MGRPLKRDSPTDRRRARLNKPGTNGDGADRRGELLTAAAHVFATKGVGNTTMRDIADEAGILSGSLYHHFVSKDLLLEEILRGVLDDLTVRYREVRDADLDPMEAMESLFRVALAFVVEYRDVTSIVVNDYTYLHSVEAFSFVEEITAAHQAIWRDVLKRGIATGVFRSDLPVDVVYRSMMGSIVQAVRWYQPKPKLRVDDMAKACASLFLKGLIDR